MTTRRTTPKGLRAIWRRDLLFDPLIRRYFLSREQRWPSCMRGGAGGFSRH
jgi:hypothetical protein